MLEEKSIRGYWWVDANPNRTVPGKLEYNPDGNIELHLLSPLNPDIRTFTPNYNVEYDRIYGHAENDEYITLLRCKRDKAQISGGNQSIQTSKFIIGSFIEGYAFSFGKDIEFASISFEYPLLDQWAGITGVSMNLGFDDEEDGNQPSVEAGDSFDFSYEVPDSIEAKVDDYNISVSVGSKINTKNVGGMSIDESTNLTVDKDGEEITYEELYDLNKKLQDFVTFAVRKPTFPSTISAKFQIGASSNNSMNIVFDQISEIDPPERFIPNKSNFILSDIHESFEETMAIWFDLYSELEDVFNLYFGTKYNNTMYMNNQFLGFTQALETYHRHSNYTGTYLDEDEFDEYKEELAETIHEDYDQSFQDHMVDGVFKHANEYSLRKRLNGLVAAHENVLADLPWNVDSEINPITNTRNYLTHYDDDIDEEMDRLYEFSLILEALLEACLLTDLGISEDHIRQRLGSRYHELTRDMDLPTQEE